MDRKKIRSDRNFVEHRKLTGSKRLMRSKGRKRIRTFEQMRTERKINEAFFNEMEENPDDVPPEE